MRAWACVATVACVVLAGVAGQKIKDPNTRLGLVADQLGVDPVPGGNPNGSPGSSRQESLVCQCIPVNQVCPYDPKGNPTGVVTRIANTQPLLDGRCQSGLNPCCGLQHVPGGGFPEGPGSGGRCGGRSNFNLQGIPPQADFGEYPWMAVVLSPDNSYLGGGVLIRNNWVLTAAHKLNGTNRFKVRLGDYNLAVPNEVPQFSHIERNVINYIIHPRFNSKSLINDVALLQLDRPVNVFDNAHIGLACLPNQGQKFEGESKCFVSGWGKDTFTNGNFQNILKEVDLGIVEAFACQHRLRQTHLGERFELNTNSFLCAGGVAGKDACTGDGGSPLVCPTRGGYTVVGLVAWGIGCAQGDIPGVYVNVANFVNFIEGYVGPLP